MCGRPKLNHAKCRAIDARWSNHFFEKPFVSRVILRSCIRIVKFVRSTWLVQMRADSGLAYTERGRAGRVGQEGSTMDLSEKVFQCPGPDDFILTQHAYVAKLPKELRDQFAEICMSYLCRFGVEGCWERMNGRTLTQIRAEFKPGEDEPIAEGEVDGVRYQVFRPKSVESADQH
jgi:hypothetical protein